MLMTGGTGFVGRSILRYLSRGDLIRNGGRVTVLTRSSASFLECYPEFREMDWLGFLEGDILRPDLPLPTGGNITHIIHAAADYNRSPPVSRLELFDQIVAGTRNILELAVRVGARRFLLTSSGGSYGIQPAGLERIPETFHGMVDPLLPDSTYGVSKRMAEHLCRLYGDKHGLETVVARCFAFVGPDLPVDGHFAIGNFIRDALIREEILVEGDGKAIRSYMYQDDLAEWLIHMLVNGQAQSAYNVGSDQATTTGELAYRVRDLVASGKQVRILGADRVKADTRLRYVPDIGKAHRELGLDVKVSLDDAIRLTARALVEGRRLPGASS